MFSTCEIKQRYLPDWVILGDNSRIILLKWLLDGERLRVEEDSLIWVRYGVKFSVTKQESQLTIETPGILPRTTLCFPPPSLVSGLDITKQTRYAVLEEFPFRKQNNIELIRGLESCENEVLVVLMDLPRQQGSTDLISEDDDLSLAIKAYQSEHCDIGVLQSAENLQMFLHWHRPIYDVWVNKARNYLDDMCERISEVPYDYLSLEEDWRDDGGPLQEKTMDSLFSYKVAMRERKNNLWDCYAEAAKRALFPACDYGLLTPVTNLYKDCLDNPLVFWSVDTDIKDFMDSLQSEFIKKLEKEEAKGNYREVTMFHESLDEKGYLSIAARSNGNGIALNAVFSKIIKDFLCNDVKDHLQNRLQKCYRQLESMSK